MQFELIERVAIWVALILSVVNIIIAVLTFEIGREKFKPQLAVSLKNLPQRGAKGHVTVIEIKNNGERDALLDGIEVEFKPVLDHPFTIAELKNNRIAINAVVSEAVRLPEPVSGMNQVLVTVHYRYGWRGRQTRTKVLDYNYEVA